MRYNYRIHQDYVKRLVKKYVSIILNIMPESGVLIHYSSLLLSGIDDIQLRFSGNAWCLLLYYGKKENK